MPCDDAAWSGSSGCRSSSLRALPRSGVPALSYPETVERRLGLLGTTGVHAQLWPQLPQPGKERRVSAPVGPHSQVRVTDQQLAWIGHAAIKDHSCDHVSRGRVTVHLADKG
jgi:hypothetical protein